MKLFQKTNKFHKQYNKGYEKGIELLKKDQNEAKKVLKSASKERSNPYFVGLRQGYYQNR